MELDSVTNAKCTNEPNIKSEKCCELTYFYNRVGSKFYVQVKKCITKKIITFFFLFVIYFALKSFSLNETVKLDEENTIFSIIIIFFKTKNIVSYIFLSIDEYMLKRKLSNYTLFFLRR